MKTLPWARCYIETGCCLILITWNSLEMFMQGKILNFPFQSFKIYSPESYLGLSWWSWLWTRTCGFSILAYVADVTIFETVYYVDLFRQKLSFKAHSYSWHIPDTRGLRRSLKGTSDFWRPPGGLLDSGHIWEVLWWLSASTEWYSWGVYVWGQIPCICQGPSVVNCHATTWF